MVSEDLSGYAGAYQSAASECVNSDFRSHTTKYSGHLGVTLKSGPQ